MNIRARLDDVRPFYVVVGITLFALLLRVTLLGERIAHWDEGRVGFDILRYMATGAWEYRPIVHGPFIPHINKYLFSVLGPTDASARLIIALVGGVLPLSAWLYRNHLRDIEMVALAGFLALDPILLYYSRFMRNDVLVAAFFFIGFGLFVRLVDTGQRRYLYAGTAAVALSFTTKENALLYPIVVIGGLLLLFDHRLFLARDDQPRWTTVVWDRVSSVARTLFRYKWAIGIAALEFLVIIMFFYAPRAGETAGIGLWKAVGQPGMFPAVIEEATIKSGEKVADVWLGGGGQDHAYLPFLGHYLEKLGSVSGPLVLLAIIGFLVDRYSGDRPSDLISIGFYWGLVSVLGYPIAVDIRASWAVIHAIVPLALPAAAGMALIYDWGVASLRDDDRISVGLAALVMLLIVGQIGATAVSTSYINPQANTLVQFAQPEGEMRPALDAMDRASREADSDIDVIWYGNKFLVENESLTYRLPVGDGEWYNRLPLPWYTERAGATVDSVSDNETLYRQLSENPPPVIITCDGKDCPSQTNRDELAEHLDGYVEFSYQARYLKDRGVFNFIFLIDRDYVDPAHRSGTNSDPTN